jgi:hypothetical protein
MLELVSSESSLTCQSCSLPCYKLHKIDCHAHAHAPPASPLKTDDTPPGPSPLRPLTSLKWPYAPEESAYPDPLKRDDPKLLQLHQYEAIGMIPLSSLCIVPTIHHLATSPAIRNILASHPSLKELLISIDKVRGEERELALQKALGVTSVDIHSQTQQRELSEDTLALRQLAEAIEAAVRGENKSALGLDWADASD